MSHPAHTEELVNKSIYTGYTDNLALLTNALTQVECLLHSLEQATSGIGMSMNSNKTDFMCFNQYSAISSISNGLWN